MIRATIVGAGGLGGPIALALGAAGVELTIVDHDLVEASNLPRQIQFTTADVGRPKASCCAAAVIVRGGNARGVVARWSAENADELTAGADVVLDGSDDPTTKFAVSDWAVAHQKPYVIAAALRYGGNVMAGAPGAACYRCLFEAPVAAETCADTGVLGPVVGAIGGVAAAIGLGLANGDRALAGALLAFDDLRKRSEPRIVRFDPRPDCPACGKEKT